jgi:hypothetical protein
MLSVGLSDCADIPFGALAGFDGACASARPDTTQANAAMIARCFTAVDSPLC